MANSIIVQQVIALAERAGGEAADLRELIGTTADTAADALLSATSTLTTAIATAKTESATDFNTKFGDLSTLTTTAKGSVVLAVNEVKGLVATAQETADNAASAVADLIDDVAPSAATVYSSTKTDLQIKNAVDAVVDGATDALNTLKELSTALGDDADFASTVTEALGKRISVDAPQVFTAPQLAQAQSNMDVFSKAEVTAAVKVVSDSIGDLNNLDLVAVFNAALAPTVG